MYIINWSRTCLDCGSTINEGQPALVVDKENHEILSVVSNNNFSSSEHMLTMKESTQSSTEEQQLATLTRKPVGSAASPAQVRLVSTVRLPVYYSAIVPVQVEELRDFVLIKPECSLDDCLQVDESLVRVSEDGLTTLLIINNGKSSCQLRSGVELAQAYEVDLELTDDTSEEQVSTSQL